VHYLVEQKKSKKIILANFSDISHQEMALVSITRKCT
jgi:hypothetical protein